MLPCRPRTGVNYALATVYLLLAIVIIIVAFAFPGLTSTEELALGLLGGFQFILALVHIGSVAALTRPVDLSPPPPP